MSVKNEHGLTPPVSPYVYLLLDEHGTPFYVGKGRGRRVMTHLYEAKRGKNGSRFDRIRSMLASGHEYSFEIVSEHATDEEAGRAERDLIARLGNLTNLTKGGELGAAPIDPKTVLAKRAGILWAKALAAGHGDHPAAQLMLRESQNPSPNVAQWCPQNGVTFGWHCDKPVPLPERLTNYHAAQR